MPIELREATEADLPAVLDLLAASLGWVPNAQYAAFFRWKHQDNPFGCSPSWVAEESGRILGFRTFLRWEWTRDGEIVRAVRAVDTATHPDAQGKGLFTKLTMHGVQAMRDEGVSFVFNTPNAQSRLGYLKMGWRDIGRLPVWLRPRSPMGAVRAATARVAADMWSTPTDAGLAPADAFADADPVERLLASLSPPPTGALRTNRSVQQLRWRYGFEPLAYRVAPIDGPVDHGVVVFRLRRRGRAMEAAITDVLAPPGAGSKVRRTVSRILRDTGADHAISLGPEHPTRIPLPGQGPRLTWRDVCDAHIPPLSAWALSLGDIELF